MNQIRQMIEITSSGYVKVWVCNWEFYFCGEQTIWHPSGFIFCRNPHIGFELSFYPRYLGDPSDIVFPDDEDIF